MAGRKQELTLLPHRQALGILSYSPVTTRGYTGHFVACQSHLNIKLHLSRRAYDYELRICHPFSTMQLICCSQLNLSRRAYDYELRICPRFSTMQLICCGQARRLDEIFAKSCSIPVHESK